MEIFTFPQQPIKIMPLAFNLRSLNFVKNDIALEANALCESCNGEVDIGIWHFKEKNATFTF